MQALIGHVATAVAVPSGQGLKQLGELALALALSSLIGLEREWRQKAAGLRTHTLVGVGAALFVLVSKYGFSDVLTADRSVVLDPSRVAAQIVSGLGFIGGGLIFVHRGSVRGLTTAAIVWDTEAIGMAAGAGLPLLALFATGAHFVAVFGGRWVGHVLPRSRNVGFGLRVVYEDGRGILRRVLEACTEAGFAVSQVSAHQLERRVAGVAAVAVDLEVRGQTEVEPVATRLEELDGVLEVVSRDLAQSGD